MSDKSSIIKNFVAEEKMKPLMFTYNGKSFDFDTLAKGLKMMETSGGTNVKLRFEPKYHKELIASMNRKDDKRWIPTTGEKKMIEKYGLDEALKLFSTSRGEYQILPETAYRYTSFADDLTKLDDPQVSANVMKELLTKWHKQYKGDLGQVINRWNQGEDYLPKLLKYIK